MKFSRPDADIYVPDGDDADKALARTTHLCVIAHQDDIEINAYPAVAECYGKADKFFTGVTVTNGAGSPRAEVHIQASTVPDTTWSPTHTPSRTCTRC